MTMRASSRTIQSASHSRGRRVLISMVLNLADFPLDLLGEISEYLLGDEVACLWFCGFSKLQLKLKHGGVRKLAVLFRPWRKLSWPTLPASLSHLIEFSCQFELPELNFTIESVNWSLIPSTLVKIEALFPGTYESFCIALFNGTLSLPHLKSLSLTCHKSQDIPALRVSKPFHDILPRLEVLKLTRPRNSTLSPYVDPSIIQRLLTPSMVELYCNLLFFCQTGDTNEWPPGLTRLYLQPSVGWASDGHRKVFSPSWISSLPKSLLHLTMGPQGPCIRSTDIEWLLLPPHLQTLSLNTSDIQSEQIALIPRSVTELDLGHFVETTLSLIKALPPFLVSLRGLFLDEDASDELLDALPKSLRVIDTSSLSASQLDILPPNLAFLELWDVDEFALPVSFSKRKDLRILHITTSMTLEQLANLPSGLESLTFGGRLPTDFVSLLPRKLTFLDLGFPFMNSATEQKLHNLPKSIKSLRLQAGTPQGTPMPYTPDSSILPRNLTSLSMSTIRLNKAWVANLPVTLKELSVTIDGPIVPELITGLPCPDLRSLNISLSVAIKKPLKNMFTYLPRRLTLFHLDMSGSFIFEISTMGGLPPGLTELRLPEKTQFKEDNWQKLLPKHLTHLSFAGISPRWFSAE